jgi:hypothetical protein
MSKHIGFIFLFFSFQIFSQTKPHFYIDIAQYREGLVLIKPEYGSFQVDTLKLDSEGYGHLQYNATFKMIGSAFKFIMKNEVSNKFEFLNEFSHDNFRKNKKTIQYQQLILTSMNGINFLVMRIETKKYLRKNEFDISDPLFEEKLANFK